MAFDREHFEKPFTKLRKLTKHRDGLEDPERVHKLRTNTRRVEAIVGAVEIVPSGAKSLLRGLKRVRRAAGEVRDMDVLTGKAANVDVDDERNCKIQLLHHLGAQRVRASQRLKRELKRNGEVIRSGLNKGRRGAQQLLDSEAGDEQRMAAAQALEITGQLRRFGATNRQNLHGFRKRAKQLRYVLQMANPKDEALLDGLREMQDAIGEWHDWEELTKIAKKVLAHGRSCGVIRELQLHTESSLDEALRVANRVRRELLGTRRGPAPLRIVKATAKMAA